MAEKQQRQSGKAGLPPGTLVHLGRKSSDPVMISVIDFEHDHYQSVTCDTPQDCFPFRDQKTISWINVDGLHDTKAIAAIGEHFGLHSLMLEQVLNTNHRPSFEDYGDYFFFSLKMHGMSKNGKSIVSEQVSFVVGDRWVISFQEQRGDIFDDLRKRIEENKGVIRKKGADYLFFRLVDTVVDNYFFITEHITESIDELEANILEVSSTDAITGMQKIKKQLITFRRGVSPLRDALSSVYKDSSARLDEGTVPFLHNVHQHVMEVMETIDSQREMLTSVMDLHQSHVSARTNKVMQLLTIISTIFIPLTFLAGIYGMNFDYMPELGWKYGYFAVWGVMILLIIFSVNYFRRKKWL